MKNNKKSYGIIGLGKFGTALATKLTDMGAEIMVVDKDESKVAEIRDLTENAYIASVLEKKTLSDMGFQNCDVVIVCIGEALDVSILTVMKLQSLGVKRIIAKANSEEHGEILEKLGAEIVYPEQDMAIRLANRLEIGHAMDFIELSESIDVVKFNVPSEFIYKTIQDVSIRKNFGLNIIAIENKGTVVDTIRPNYVFKENDTLYLCGNKKCITDFSVWMESRK
ncbi:MAG: TrkA family potassium uptake protein [Ruminococcaceae bacterium]|nr:TrkA family potassium uptake protein [Oscillospiraceae bacterium]